MGRVGQLTQLHHCGGQIETLGSVAGKVGRVSRLLRELQECVKLCLDIDNEPVMNWVKRRLTNIDDFVVGVCYTLPDQDVIVDEALKQLRASLFLLDLVFMGNLKHPNI